MAGGVSVGRTTERQVRLHEWGAECPADDDGGGAAFKASKLLVSFNPFKGLLVQQPAVCLALLAAVPLPLHYIAIKSPLSTSHYGITPQFSKYSLQQIQLRRSGPQIIKIFQSFPIPKQFGNGLSL